MAIRKLDRTFAPKKKEIRYLNKSFPEFRQSLVDFAKVYFPDTYNDFNESSPGMMFIEMASYVGDVLSYYIDSQFKESLMAYAQEQDNIISMAQAMGYKPKPGTASVTQLDVFQMCPALDYAGNYLPDERFYLRIDAGMVLSAPQYNTQFRTSQIIDFADSANREISVYAKDGLEKPLTYLIKKTVMVSSGIIKEFRYVFDTPERFSRFTLPDKGVLEILRVDDSAGNRWYEVDYLAQDLVFSDVQNSRPASIGESSAPYFNAKLKRVPRRFVTRYNSDFYLELLFGSGTGDSADELVNIEPNKIASSEYQTNLASTALDPSDFLSSRSYGQAPNTELIVSYVTGGGVESNVPSTAISKVNTVKFLNDTSGFTPAEQGLFIDIEKSIVVNNAFAAMGGKDADSVDEIRLNAMAFFNAQNRLVTPQDYIVRSYAMPPKYGGIAKVFVAKDEQINDVVRMTTRGQAPVGGIFVNNPINPNVVNLYVLGYNQYKKLLPLNAEVKKNLSTYLENYRMLTDEVHIMDGFVVNIGVEFRIIAYKSYNMNEVLTRCIDAIKEFFNIDKWDINQPIIINDLYMEIAQVDGVQNLSNVTIFNRYAYKDGSDYENFLYDITAATENGIIYPSLDPMIWEVRYPERDIIGHANQ